MSSPFFRRRQGVEAGERALEDLGATVALDRPHGLERGGDRGDAVADPAIGVDRDDAHRAVLLLEVDGHTRITRLALVAARKAGQVELEIGRDDRIVR